MKARPDSQAGRILALLEQGGWWSTSELLREVPAVVHSRIDGLRKQLKEEGQGRTIEHKRVGPGAAGSLYQLVGVAPSAEDAEGGAPARSAPGGLASLSPRQEGVGAAAAPSDSQLALPLSARLRDEAA